MINLVFISATSASFELINDQPYFSPKKYDVLLNGKKVLGNQSTNVFSIYGLFPDTEYLLSVCSMEINFKTLTVNKVVNILDLNPYQDGINYDNKAFEKAIEQAGDNGYIIVPKGTYLLTPLFLKSNLTIELEKGATLLGATNRLDYPILEAQIIKEDGSIIELSSWEGTPARTHASLITGILVSNVKIIGEGVIDCNAQNSDWWVNHKVMRNNAWRPKGIFLSNCNNIGFQGITVKNTPSWNLHPYFSNNLEFIDLKLESPKDSPNTDGLDPESCSDVKIIGVNFSVGDDCIAIKSGKFDMGMKYRMPSQRILIRNCYMAYGHGAIVLGSECSGGIRDLEVNRCYFYNTDRGLRIKTRRGRGESMIIDDVKFENIIMDQVKVPFVGNMFYHCDPDGKTEYVWSKKALPIDERTPFLGRFEFKDIQVTNAHAAAAYFYGLKERPIKSVKFTNVSISFSDQAISFLPAMMCHEDEQVKRGMQFRNVETVELENVRIIGHLGREVELVNVKNFSQK